jgi:hypothetical protein
MRTGAIEPDITAAGTINLLTLRHPGRATPFWKWHEIAPVARWLPDEVALRLDVPRTAEELTPSHWQDALEGVAEATNDAVIGGFYAFAASSDVSAPGSVQCRIGASHGMRPPESVAVAHDRMRFDALRDLEHPVVLVDTP